MYLEKSKNQNNKNNNYHQKTIKQKVIIIRNKNPEYAKMFQNTLE